MNPLDRLTGYLAGVERRLRWLALSRGAAITAVAALGFTITAVLVANNFAFAPPSVLASRLGLFLGIGFALALGLIVPLVRINRRRAARAAEQRFPEFEERLLTLTERMRDNPADPFLPLIASDSLRVAERAEPDRIAAGSRMAAFGGAAACSLAVLVWLGTSGPGFLGYGTSLLWGGIPKEGVKPFYDVVVEPGNRTIRKRADQIVSAKLVGFRSERVRVLAKFASSSKWEQAEMQPQSGGSGWQFLFAGVPESFEYYVEAGGVRSKSYRLNAVDLPGVKRIRVTYRYPAWSGMKDAVEDPGGDLRAVEGTRAEVSVETDRPLAAGALLLDDGRKLPLRAEGKRYVATVPIEKDGLYHIASAEQGEDVRLTEDYFIEAQKDRPPSVRIARPGRDARVSPIEEVTVAVEGKDDFGLRELTLHYSVNAGPEQKRSMLKDGSTTLYLEDYKLAPGDIVSMYATARDARATARTDIFFLEAQPFEREYTQSQQAGGGGGGGGEQGEDGKISQRQKEIIAATWNQIKDADKTAAGENATFLSGVQSKLRDQARSLVNRMRSRQLAGANDSFKSFVTDMDKAIEAMGPATERLKGREFQRALEPEQKALQHLLRAEATFRNIQVAFGNRGGGGGGGGMGRDLEGLFDLELDTEKNQYETGQQSASASDQRQREIDEALQKLEQLARRQQELAEQQRRNQQQVSQQRWQQEMLRREAERLRQQIEQLARNNSQSGQQGQSGQQSQSGQQGQSGQQSRSGQGQGGGAQSEQLRRAIEQVDQATRQMRQAAGSQSAGTPQSEADARRAAERLKEARDLLSGMRRQEAGQQMNDLVEQAEKLAGEQRNFGNKMRQAFGSQGLLDPNAGRTSPNRQQAEQLAEEKQRMTQEVRKLEAEMQRSARAMAGTQREAAGKLREALGNLQQEEVASRMKWSADAIRRGLGAYAVMREALTTQALEQLRDNLREARGALREGQQGAQPGGNGNRDLERALAETENLRRQLEQMRQQPGARGQGPGAGGEREQRGQQGGGDRGGGYSAMNRGDWQPAPGGRAEDMERAYQQGVRDLGRLQEMLAGQPELARDVEGLMREMQRLDPKRFPGNPELLSRMHSQVLAEVEQMELRLRRMLDGEQGGNVRSSAGQPPPPEYADAVAEYFRRLSKDK